MSNMTIQPYGFCESVGQSTSTSAGTVLSASSANTKTGWTQLVASTAVQWDAFQLIITQPSVQESALLDISLGTSSDEDNHIIVENAMFGGSDPTTGFKCLIPISVPASSRISIRFQSFRSSGDISVQLVGMTGQFGINGVRKAIGYGVNTADSGGVTITFGNSNSWGSWGEIVASSADDIIGFIACESEIAWASSAYVLWEVGKGAAASEVTIMGPAHSRASSGFDFLHQGSFYGPFFYPVPSGTRLAVRGQTAATTGTNQIDFSLLALVA
jgi:hypothetical protein